ncbi:MAG: radical SAM protein [Chloroflexi bacterium]|nr:MAG: radical SAM protein [Chloroflexota bacterium]
MYLRPDSQTRLVLGDSGRGALYDLRSGRVYWLDAASVNALLGLALPPGIQGESEELPEPYGSVARSMIDKGLGQFSSIPVANDWVHWPHTRTYNPRSAVGIRPSLAWLEVEAGCNLRCSHCYGSFGPDLISSRLRIASVTEERRPAVRLTPTDWLSAIEQLAELRPVEESPRLVFIGGEPYLNPGLETLMESAVRLGFAVEVFSAGYPLRDANVQFLRTHGITYATTVYSHSASRHDAVTGREGSHARLVRNLRKLLDAGVTVRVEMVLMRINQEDHERTRHWLADIGVQLGPPDPVRLKGRANESLLPELQWEVKYWQTAPRFRTSVSSFEKALAGNPCWAGELAVTSGGDVLPCIFERKKVVGNILRSSLKEILYGDSSRLLPLWSMTKDSIAACSGCEFRYCCGDCRVLGADETCDANWEKTPRCTYDPVVGVWEAPKSASLRAQGPNNSMQRTALRAAADAER